MIYLTITERFVMLSKEEKIARLEKRASDLCQKFGVDVFHQTEYKRISTQLKNLKNK